MQATQIWQAALGELSRFVPRPDFDTWLRTSTIVDFADGVVIVAMPNSFAVQWIESRHASLVQRTLSGIIGYQVVVRFAVREGDSYFLPGGAVQPQGAANNSQRTAAQQSEVANSAGATGYQRNGDSAVQAAPATASEAQQRAGSQSAFQGSLFDSGGSRTSPSTQAQETGNNGRANGDTSSSAAKGTNGVQQPASNNRFYASRDLPSVAETMGTDNLPMLNPRYLFEHFIVGSSNRMAHAASMAVADNPANAYNPLFLYGGVGLGKTHLLHAIGHAAMEKFPGVRVLYVSSEKFTNDLINAIRDHTNEDFRSRYRSIDILMIDDIQFIAGKESTQEEFFHTFNALHGAGRQLVISSDRPPKAILTLEERLRSRFEGGLIADIQPPDIETRIAILRTKGETTPIPVPTEVIDYVAHKVQSNIRELEGALNRIIAYAQLNQKPLTVEVASLALNDLAANTRRKNITPKRVIETVAQFYNLELEDLVGKSRSREVVVPRQVAMYIIREETDSSLSDIGAEFGNRDHTTVMHSCEKIERAKEFDNQIRQAILAIRQMLYGELAG